MDGWGPRTYGEPCQGCGFSWRAAVPDAVASVAAFPTVLAHDVADAAGDEHGAGLAWSVTAYVAHVSDNLRIWSERIAGVTLGGSSVVTSYDENLLATARAYEAVSGESAMWGLEHSVRDWLEAVAGAPAGLTLTHPERGVLEIDQIVRGNAHDAIHHLWDIRRILAVQPKQRAWGVVDE